MKTKCLSLFERWRLKDVHYSSANTGASGNFARNGVVKGGIWEFGGVIEASVVAGGGGGGDLEVSSETKGEGNETQEGGEREKRRRRGKRNRMEIKRGGNDGKVSEEDEGEEDGKWMSGDRSRRSELEWTDRHEGRRRER